MTHPREADLTKFTVKATILVFSLLVGGALAYIAAPFANCAYKNHLYKQLITVRINVPECREKGHSEDGRSGQCFVAFENARTKDSIVFRGSGLISSFDVSLRKYIVSGEGAIESGGNSLEIKAGQILVNRQRIPVQSLPLRFIVKNDGTLENEFCDVSW